MGPPGHVLADDCVARRALGCDSLLSEEVCAGFTHEAPVGNNYEPASPGFEAHVRSISETWLRFPVGDRYRYSNLGFDLAGYILEQKAGIGYAEWLRRKLFEPAA